MKKALGFTEGLFSFRVSVLKPQFDWFFLARVARGVGGRKKAPAKAEAFSITVKNGLDLVVYVDFNLVNSL